MNASVPTCFSRKTAGTRSVPPPGLGHRVDNFFQPIKRRRAVVTRYDKLDLNRLASIQLVAKLHRLTLPV